MKLKMFFKHLKANQFDLFETLEKTGESVDIIPILYKYYPFLRDSIEDQIYADESIFYLGNSEQRARIIRAVYQNRLVILSGPQGTGKSYFVNEKFKNTHELVFVDLARKKIKELFQEVGYSTLIGKPKIVVVDSLDKFNKQTMLQLNELMDACRVPCIIITRIAPKMLKRTYKLRKKEISLNAEVIEFKEANETTRTAVLTHLFPNLSVKIIKKAAKMYPLYKGIQILKYGATSRNEVKQMRVKDIVGQVLINTDRQRVYAILKEQKINLTTLVIYLAEQNLNAHNREVVDKISMFVYVAKKKMIMATVAFSIIPQKIHIVTPDTTTRRKWNLKDKKATVKKKTAKRRKPKKRTSKKRSKKRGGFDIFRTK